LFSFGDAIKSQQGMTCSDGVALALTSSSQTSSSPASMLIRRYDTAPVAGDHSIKLLSITVESQGS
jgi:hypothetical protein